MTNSLASTEQAQLILKLYELRTEAVMREARTWLARTFWPNGADEVFALFADGQAKESGYFNQVLSYWEMAASFVLHGALDVDFFVDCNSEPFFFYGKLLPLLPELRKHSPEFFKNTEAVIERSPAAQARVERFGRTFAARQQSTQGDDPAGESLRHNQGHGRSSLEA